MTLSAHVTAGGWGRLFAGLLAAVLLAGLTPVAQAGNHGGDQGPPEGRGGGSPGGSVDEDPEGITRISGPNRFVTAVALSQYSHPEGDVDEVFIATGGDFADALAGAPAAAAADAPVLFAPPGTINHIADELERLNPETVTVFGGPAAVAPPIIDKIEALLGDEVAVERLGGGNRFETAAVISDATHPDGADEVFLATGGRFPDALAGAPIAASLDAPVLLTGADSLPETTTAALERLEPSTVTVLGGSGAISDDVLDEVVDATGAEVRRIAGDDRFGTAIAASQFLQPETGTAETGTAYVATGLGWADALAGAAAAGADAAPVLLTTPGQLPDAVAEELRRLNPAEVVVLGGPGAVTSKVANQVADALADDGEGGDEPADDEPADDEENTD